VYNGEIWLDETKVSPNAAIHEYTHLWDNALMRVRPALWRRGKKLMRQTSLWNEGTVLLIKNLTKSKKNPLKTVPS